MPANKQIICGVDEAGRGPLVGKVYAAAVILDDQNPIFGLKDSKKLSASARKSLYSEITEKAKAYSIAYATVEEIDRLNILQATLLAMKRAVLGLMIKPDLVLVDGNQKPILNISVLAIIKGDSLVQEISAASILAKVARDTEMEELDKIYPEYGFAKHKGYGTKLHMEALVRYGPSPIHRQSFAPVKRQMASDGNDVLISG